MLEIANFNQCEGKDTSNYTWVDAYTIAGDCAGSNADQNSDEYLVSCNAKGEKTVIGLQNLAKSSYPAGGNP